MQHHRASTLQPKCWLSLASGLLLFLAAGFCFWQSGWTPGNTAGLHATVLSPSRSAKPAPGPYQTKRIADIVPMDWVLAGNPENEFDLQFGDDVDPAEWRLLTLVAPKKNGGTADVRMLRPGCVARFAMARPQSGCCGSGRL
ncbi:MAG TPA: hypothetical protein VFG20_09890 [Planctomycetaceae bacterium]|jgi:hypothetical protein|nr:hypothetical protein [Planctomycetaceae bacterium]